MPCLMLSGGARKMAPPIIPARYPETTGQFVCRTYHECHKCCVEATALGMNCISSFTFANLCVFELTNTGLPEHPVSDSSRPPVMSVWFAPCILVMMPGHEQ
jgi:hypothetical protein